MASILSSSGRRDSSQHALMTRVVATGSVDCVGADGVGVGGSTTFDDLLLVGGDMVIRKNAKPTEPKQSTHARGVYELCGGLGEPILHHIYENFPRKYPNFLNWA